ncbi:MAG TPA: ABC transporter substrate-binding protein [bacterium]|nr:ABC transporter substrate-binding protein [bacterium]
MRRVATAVLIAALLAGLPALGQGRPIVVGAVYPADGPQAGPGGGLDEYHGLLLAAAYVNGRGGVNGRSVQIRLASAPSSDAAPGAVEQLAESGMTAIVGTYGSVIARPAAETAAHLGLVYWETGAVGDIPVQAEPGRHFFRVAPAGAVLGREAVAFVRDRLAPRLHRPAPLRYTVAYVDDAFGRSEAQGEIAEIRRSGLPLAASLPFNPWHADYAGLTARIAASRTDVLIVGAYMENAVALRQAILLAHVPLAVNIGGCSAYIMPEFGRRLGAGAVGVFSADKTGDLLPTRALTPQAADALVWARREFQRRYGHPLWEPALSGFTGGIALFQDVLPRAHDLSPAGIAAAARRADVAAGALPNGAGLAFGAPGTADAGENLRAASVIWEWIAPNTRALVWPPEFATHAVVLP